MIIILLSRSFGMGVPGRKFAEDESYRYGFNGQEKSTEIDPTGNSMTAEFWQYDARIGRRWNVDPLFKKHESPYATFANNPIWFIDRDGADTIRFSMKVTMKVGGVFNKVSFDTETNVTVLQSPGADVFFADLEVVSGKAHNSKSVQFFPDGPTGKRTGITESPLFDGIPFLTTDDFDGVSLAKMPPPCACGLS